jgi:hypothetical protein
LSRSPLGIQCEVLSLMVKHRESIVYLIKKLINLRVLTVRCEDDKHSVGLANKNEFIEWLINHLPSTCSIVRDPESNNCIRICL